MRNFFTLLLVLIAVSACSSGNSDGDADLTGDDACAGVGCGDDVATDDSSQIDDDPQGTDDDAPWGVPLRNAIALSDEDVATQAAALLGIGTDTACASCHTLSRQRLRYWETLTNDVVSRCLTDLTEPSAQVASTTISCLKTATEFRALSLGIFSAATHLSWFTSLFTIAASSEHAAFEDQAGMPRGASSPWTQEQFDIVAEWFARALPLLDDKAELGEPVCVEAVAPGVAQLVDQRAIDGWAAINVSREMEMVDWASFPLVSTIADSETWEVAGFGTMHVLASLDYMTQYETAVSADGRFIGHGGSDTEYGASIIDLTRGVTVAVNASYDPSFFPDGAGFIMQGGSRNICNPAVLTSDPETISMTETGCASLATIGLEQSAATLLSGDYRVASGNFRAFSLPYNPLFGDGDANFTATSFRLSRLVFNGSSFTAQPALDIAGVDVGDVDLAPSGTTAMRRYSNQPVDAQAGYIFSTIDESAQTMTEIARYCMTGTRMRISYDERWAAYAHVITDSERDAVELGFTGRADPAFAEYASKGTSNIYLLDLKTGLRHRITTMAPGQYAAYPSFRSDGWMSFNVRDIDVDQEWVIATEAARLATF